MAMTREIDPRKGAASTSGNTPDTFGSRKGSFEPKTPKLSDTLEYGGTGEPRASNPSLFTYTQPAEIVGPRSLRWFSKDIPHADCRPFFVAVESGEVLLATSFNGVLHRGYIGAVDHAPDAVIHDAEVVCWAVFP
jgi:hypothetical protein